MNETKVSQKSNSERERESKSVFFGQNWSGEAMVEKEKEILDPRKVFPLFFLFPEKVEWESKKVLRFTL